ncbi:GNAT family N-acetyltransferase [Nocardia caishijiensis]|uniref:Acetyltransferase (GNAT) family protein n=1 Tax=Nocardia caishijiensis TaxID=184756 RepID=A0ABQ6YER4_9NOCA|nr:GNAT family N-acetyltransferase [Nocardia caishijiensis]KAF0835905.1 acetyltransferase (GNAT) family protein [Nocardia caishijiensis]
MVEWRIVPATADRVTALAACHIASWREAYGSLVPAPLLAAFDLDSSASTWERRRRDDRYRLVVAHHDDELIGFAAASRQPVGSELEALYVRSAWHGTGVADELLATAVPEPSCALWVLADYPRAHAFYRRHGFTDTGRRRIDPFTLLPEQRWRRGPRYCDGHE